MVWDAFLRPVSAVGLVISGKNRVKWGAVCLGLPQIAYLRILTHTSRYAI